MKFNIYLLRILCVICNEIIFCIWKYIIIYLGYDGISKLFLICGSRKIKITSISETFMLRKRLVTRWIG